MRGRRAELGGDMAKQQDIDKVYHINLILLNGDEIKVYYKDSIAVEVLGELEECQKNGTLWWCDNWGDRIQAVFNGHSLTHIDMSKVVAWGDES